LAFPPAYGEALDPWDEANGIGITRGAEVRA
jgi:hypothetical protein